MSDFDRERQDGHTVQTIVHGLEEEKLSLDFYDKVFQAIINDMIFPPNSPAYSGKIYPYINTFVDERLNTIKECEIHEPGLNLIRGSVKSMYTSFLEKKLKPLKEVGQFYITFKKTKQIIFDDVETEILTSKGAVIPIEFKKDRLKTIEKKNDDVAAFLEISFQVKKEEYNDIREEINGLLGVMEGQIDAIISGIKRRKELQTILKNKGEDIKELENILHGVSLEAVIIDIIDVLKDNNRPEADEIAITNMEKKYDIKLVNAADEEKGAVHVIQVKESKKKIILNAVKEIIPLLSPEEESLLIKSQERIKKLRELSNKITVQSLDKKDENT